MTVAIHVRVDRYILSCEHYLQDTQGRSTHIRSSSHHLKNFRDLKTQAVFLSNLKKVSILQLMKMFPLLLRNTGHFSCKKAQA